MFIFKHLTTVQKTHNINYIDIIQQIWIYQTKLLYGLKLQFLVTAVICLQHNIPLSTDSSSGKYSNFLSTSSNFVQIQHHTTNHALSTYKQAMIITKTVNFSMRCDRCFVPLNVVHLFRMVKTCNSGIIQKQKGERDQFLILLFDHQCLLLISYLCKPMCHEDN